MITCENFSNSFCSCGLRLIVTIERRTFSQFLYFFFPLPLSMDMRFFCSQKSQVYFELINLIEWLVGVSISRKRNEKFDTRQGHSSYWNEDVAVIELPWPCPVSIVRSGNICNVEHNFYIPSCSSFTKRNMKLFRANKEQTNERKCFPNPIINKMNKLMGLTSLTEFNLTGIILIYMYRTNN